MTHVSSLYEFARLVETSSNSGLNKAQLVGTHDGRIIVPVHDWASFLASILESSRTLRSVIISGFLRKTLEWFIIKNL